ncbi:MAG: DMT family transporter [Alphaproteobacteria bacterium]
MGATRAPEPAARPAAAEAGHAPSQGSALGLLAVSVVLFGTAWPVMKVGVQEMTPLWFAAARLGLGALAAFLLLFCLGRFRLPGRADLPIVLSIGTCQLALFIGLGNVALQFVPAGRTVVLAYTTSLWLVPLALLTGERIGARRLGGVGLGLAGVVVLMNPAALDWSDPDMVAGHLILLLAALGWALAIFHARRHRWHLSPLQVLPWQMLWAAALLTPAALVFEPGGGVAGTASALAILVYLGVFAGPVASWAATSVARALPTVVSSVGFLGVPAVGLLVSAAWLGEPVTPALGAGAVLVLVGLLLVALGAARGR